MRIVFVSAIAFLIGAGAAFAQAQPQGLSQPTTTPATTSTPANAPSDQKICKVMYFNGELIRTQTCRTKAEWDAIRRRSQQDVEQQQLRALTSSPH